MAKRRPLKHYIVDVDFYSIEYKVTARGAAEARRKVKDKIKKGVALKNVNHMYVDEDVRY